MPQRYQFLIPWLFLVVWSSGYSMAKLALEFTLPFNLLAYRFLGAALVVTPLVLLMRLPLPNWTHAKSLIGTGIFLHLGHFGTMYVGMKLGASANIMALFAASQPVLIILTGALLAKQMPSWKIWVGLMLGLTGAAWVIGVDMQGDTGYVLGAILGFVAVVGMSIGQVIEKRRSLPLHPLVATWVQYIFAAIISVPLALVTEGIVFDPTPAFFFSVGHLIIMNTVVGIMLMFAMVRSGTMSQATAIMFLVPAVAAIIAWPVAGETVPLIAVPGMLLAMAGAIWTRKVTQSK